MSYTAPTFVNGGAPPLNAANLNALTRAVQYLDQAAFNVQSYGATGNGTTDDTAAIQSAVNAAVGQPGGTVLFPAGTYKVSASITLGEHLVLAGVGQPTLVATTTAPVFLYATPNGTAERDAPQFLGFRFTARNAIQLNSVAGGFTDDSTSQCFLMRPVIEDCQFSSDVAGSGIAVQFNKCFDYNIRRCLFNSYSVGIDLNGSDIGTVDNNRLKGCTTAQIRLTSYGTFGSTASITRNDMLDATSGCFILSSDYDLRVRDNYFESTAHAISAVIRSTGGYALRVTGNRVDVPASLAPNWLDVQQPLIYGEFIGNHTTGNAFGPAKFPTAGATYYYTNGNRQRIVHSGNTEPSGMPFNSVDHVIKPPRTAWLWTPDLPGLDNSNYAMSAIVSDRALVLPATTGFGSLVQFSTNTNGTVDIGIVARGATAGQVLQWQYRSGGSPITTSTVTLTADYAYYQLASAVSVTACQLLFWNNATTSIYLKTLSLAYS